MACPLVNHPCWFHGPRIISEASNVVFWTFFRAKTCFQFVEPIVSATVEQKWREKMSEKPHSIRLLRWFNFSQSESRENNKKAFEGASMEPTNPLEISTAIYLATYRGEWLKEQKLV